MAKNVDEQTTIKFIGRDSLRAVTTQFNNLTGQITKKAKELRDVLKGAEADKSLHVPAFRDMQKLVKLGETSPVKLRAYLANWDEYRERFKLDEVAKQQGDFVAAKNGKDDKDSASAARA